MIKWSVELEANSWNDDTFNGTYDECVKYCEENDYQIDGVNAQLAEIEIDDSGCVTYTHEIIKEL